MASLWGVQVIETVRRRKRFYADISELAVCPKIDPEAKTTGYQTARGKGTDKGKRGRNA
jgi:hypothetical protein